MPVVFSYEDRSRRGARLVGYEHETSRPKRMKLQRSKSHDNKRSSVLQCDLGRFCERHSGLGCALEFRGDFWPKEGCQVVSGGGAWLSSGSAWISGGSTCDSAESPMVDSEVLIGLLTTVCEEVLCFLGFSALFVVFFYISLTIVFGYSG